MTPSLRWYGEEGPLEVRVGVDDQIVAGVAGDPITDPASHTAVLGEDDDRLVLPNRNALLREQEALAVFVRVLWVEKAADVLVVLASPANGIYVCRMLAVGSDGRFARIEGREWANKTKGCVYPCRSGSE